MNLAECVPWVDAVVNATAEAGFECGLRVYQDGHYSWWPIPIDAPGADATGQSPHLRTFLKALVVCEQLRPEWVKLTPAAQEAMTP